MMIAFVPFQENLTPSFFQLLYLSIVVLLWLVLFFFSRKKRITQDWLSFYLNIFRKFYIPFLTLGAVLMSSSGAVAGCSAAGGYLLIQWISRLIFLSRSVKIVLVTQVVLGFQLLFLPFLIFMKENVHLIEIVLIFAICYLYLGSVFISLNKTRKFLLKEKAAEVFH